jgi:hypothetical protein
VDLGAQAILLPLCLQQVAMVREDRIHCMSKDACDGAEAGHTAGLFYKLRDLFLFAPLA